MRQIRLFPGSRFLGPIPYLGYRDDRGHQHDEHHAEHVGQGSQNPHPSFARRPSRLVPNRARHDRLKMPKNPCG